MLNIKDLINLKEKSTKYGVGHPEDFMAKINSMGDEDKVRAIAFAQAKLNGTDYEKELFVLKLTMIERQVLSRINELDKKGIEEAIEIMREVAKMEEVALDPSNLEEINSLIDLMSFLIKLEDLAQVS